MPSAVPQPALRFPRSRRPCPRGRNRWTGCRNRRQTASRHLPGISRPNQRRHAFKRSLRSGLCLPGRRAVAAGTCPSALHRSQPFSLRPTAQFPQEPPASSVPAAADFSPTAAQLSQTLVSWPAVHAGRDAAAVMPMFLRISSSRSTCSQDRWFCWPMIFPVYIRMVA